LESFLKKIFLSIFFILGSGVVIISLWGLLEIQLASDWPEVRGTVDKESFVNVSGNPPTSARIVKYKYIVSENEYTNSREYFGIKVACNKCSSLYSPGQKVKVYYNQNDPSDSVLKPNEHRAIWFGMFTGIVFMLFSYIAYRYDRKKA